MHTKMAKDPVCNIAVKKTKSAKMSDYQGKDYYFCSEECKDKFDQNPQAFSKKKAA